MSSEKASCEIRIEFSWNHRITEWLSLKETSGGQLVQPSWHQELVAQDHVQVVAIKFFPTMNFFSTMDSFSSTEIVNSNIKYLLNLLASSLNVENKGISSAVCKILTLFRTYMAKS